MMNAPALEHMTDTVQDVAHRVVERAPDLASAVGRGARSTVDTVSDAVSKLAYKTPFVEAPKPQRFGSSALLRIAMLAAIAGMVVWFVNRRRRTEPSYQTDDGPRERATGITERRFATAAG